MNAIYKIIGEDGREYGPATAGQVRQWIAEGRAEHRTPIFVDGAKDWNFVGLLPEFANDFSASGMPPPIAPPARETSDAGRMAKTNSYALWGMIFGILAFVCCLCCCLNIPLGALGLVFSLVGHMQINERPDYYEGRGLAIAGIVLSSLALVIGFLMLLADVANGNFHTYHHFQMQRF